MKKDVLSGALLIGGALAGMLVMALHPTAHGMMMRPGAGRLAHLNVVVHGVALLAVNLAVAISTAGVMEGGSFHLGVGPALLVAAWLASGVRDHQQYRLVGAARLRESLVTPRPPRDDLAALGSERRHRGHGHDQGRGPRPP